ncbi:MAG: phosphoribosyltransferase [Chloroflexi bacterium]|nr:phosphoribosyltransferase [Chloroflexota bacterium]
MKVKFDFEAINTRLKHIPFPEVDLVVGIATGGIVPASLVAHQLGKPMKLIHINYRDEANNPQRKQPILLKPLDLPNTPCRILLVDDISLTGSTFAVAREQLKGHMVVTFAMKGQADFVAFPEIDDQIDWPWKAQPAVVRELED